MFVLEKLWREGLSPGERYIRPNSEYKKTLGKESDEIDRLLSHLPPEGQQIFKNYYEIQSKLMSISEEDAFIRGFRLGAIIILDIVGDYKGQFRTATEGE